MIDPDSRERAALELLDAWPWELGGVVIGGYAVCAYGPPRYSSDLDIVIPFRGAVQTRGWLGNRGFQLEKHSIPNPQNYEGQVERFQSEEVTLDLLAGAVRDRDAQVDIPAGWVADRSRAVRLKTVSAGTRVSIPIARPEALWALKLQAGRGSDLSDLFAIAEEPLNTDEVAREFRELRSESLIRKLRSVRVKLEDPQLYADALSRRELGRPSDPTNRGKWARFIAQVDRILIPALSE